MGRIDRRRFAFDITPPEEDKFERLKAEFHCKSNADFVMLGASLLEWAAQQIRAQRIVGSLDDGNGVFRELMVPAFAAISIAPDSSPTTKPAPHRPASVPHSPSTVSRQRSSAPSELTPT